MFSDEPVFPTWWTALPVRAPVLTGWTAGSRADQLLDLPEPEILRHALASLTNIMGGSTGRIESVYFHDWHQDPYARGAYSYVPAGAVDARRALAEPVADTLYFAGEATDTDGHSATVHGAIETGRRAARQILAGVSTHHEPARLHLLPSRRSGD